MRILSIDPGYERVGIAIIEKENKSSKEILLFSECFKTSPKLKLSERIFIIGQNIESIIKKWKPDALAIETLFMTTNQKTVMGVSEARGVIIYEGQKSGLQICEYTPLQIKIAVTGYGKATKEQVLTMVQKLIKISNKKTLDDEIDAIAVGLTYFAQERF
ncbi:MAG: Crossover junction endodeoxyribonuclease RuvC [Candidatus Nomurabacteria bacterium GW2011_GWB1_37_5]|uniref:Crossover junction endodeoxyribonuclease RuvC n=1 Tax=Candidatus Nomurabacteria bacterium GW2011_GWB1_37_5 TaxID=1618742 RepID=A0A0G0GY17_9BACT|nr:MAG: Crossover junction endodeoxyribonuclease RuvC [Candidatus Nomurabacteria bacterium GW2011_GWB1_37_5]